MLFFFILLCCTTLVSCTREKPIEYSIFWGFASGNSGKLIVYECKDNGDKIYNRTVDFDGTEIKKTFISQPETVKIKIYIKRSNTFSLQNNRWVDQVFYLDKKKKNEFWIRPETILSTTEP